MKRTFASTILLFGLCQTSFAIMFIPVPAPQDDQQARRDVYDRPELKPFRAASRELIKTRLCSLKLDEVARIFGPKLATATNWWGDVDDVAKVFGPKPATATNWWGDGPFSGPKLDQHPADLVLPLCDPGEVGLSGLHGFNGARDQNHTDLNAISDIGYVEFYYSNDGRNVGNAVIYFRADNQFVPLKSTNDFSRRLEWDESKFDALFKWLDEHLPKLTELGVVEVSESAPRQLDLGGGTVCRLLRTKVYGAPGVTFPWLVVALRKETQDPNEWAASGQSKSINRPGESIVFSIDGKFYRMTPKLVEQFSAPIR